MASRDVVEKIDKLLCQRCWHTKAGTQNKPPACTCNSANADEVRQIGAERQRKDHEQGSRAGYSYRRRRRVA